MILLKLVGGAFFWGGTFVAGRIVAGRLPPLDAATLRYLCGGSAFLLLLCMYREWRRVTGRDLIWLALMGITGVVSFNLFFFAALQHITASRAALIVSTNPIGVLLGARLIFGDKLTGRQVAGIVLSSIGAVIVAASRPDVAIAADRWGDVLAFGCGLSWVLYALLARKAVASVPPLTSAGYSTLIGTGILVAMTAPQASAKKLSALSWQPWVAVGFMGVCGTALAFKWFVDGVSALGAGRTAQFNNLVPVFAVVLSTVVLGEHPSGGSLLGGAVVIAGLIITQTRNSASQRTFVAPASPD
jgi:drug/metabolite transporter (DMT)-like permease